MLAVNPRLKGMSDAQRERLTEFVAGNLLFVLGHEAGHAVISEMGIPVIGREEDAADIFSTLLALCAATASRIACWRMLRWAGSSATGATGVKASRWLLRRARHGSAACLQCRLPDGRIEHGKVRRHRDAARLPAERQMTCQDDYLNASWSWEPVLKSHQRQPDQPQTAITIVYGPGNGEFDQHADAARHITAPGDAGRDLSDRFVWRGPISLEMQTCGKSGARWVSARQDGGHLLRAREPNLPSSIACTDIR